MRHTIVLLSAVLGFAWICQAADWEVDPVHSSIGFSVKHLMISNVKGGFTKFTGTAKYDPADPATFSVEGQVVANWIDTGNGMRDKDLRSENFLDVVKFPTITFKSTELKKTGESTYTLTGELGIHGVTKTVTLQLKGLGAPVQFMGSTRVGFSLTGLIERDKFGLTYNKVIEGGGMVVGNEVQIDAEIEMVQPPKPASPPSEAK